MTRRHLDHRRRPLLPLQGWLLLGGFWALVLVAFGARILASRAPVYTEAPEAGQVLQVQAHMPFQILIPAYMPAEFNRAGVGIEIDQAGPGGEPMVELVYRTPQGAPLFLREWVPANPGMEVLASSRPIETKWGTGWLLWQRESLGVIWVDVGPLRVSVYTPAVGLLSREQLLQMAETLGPASNRQVFSFSLERPAIREMPPPPPVEAKMNEQGIQEITLVVTPGGYSPLRFAVRKGIPVRLTFRQLGQVGCGNEIIFPADPQNPAALALTSEYDKKILEFTPQQIGGFQFYCAHQMYRGVLTVHE